MVVDRFTLHRSSTRPSRDCPLGRSQTRSRQCPIHLRYLQLDLLFILLAHFDHLVLIALHSLHLLDFHLHRICVQVN